MSAAACSLQALAASPFAAPRCRSHVSIALVAILRRAGPTQPARSVVRAAAKRGAGGSKGKTSRLDEVAAFEQLMEDWDDAFAADCEDIEKAALVARLAEEGYSQHGRGFVFVRSQLERRSRKSAKYGSSGGGSSGASKGFGAPPPRLAEKGTPLTTNPLLSLLSWTATYIPGGVLDGVGGIFTAADGGAVLPDSSALLADDSSSGSGSSSSSNSGGHGGAAAVEELQRAMRGQDPSLLRTLVGLTSPAGADAGSSNNSGTGGGSEGITADAAAGAAAADADAGAGTMMGVRRYEPEAGELVVLLSARISGKPALGAELLVVARNEDGTVVLELPDGWEEALAMA